MYKKYTVVLVASILLTIYFTFPLVLNLKTYYNQETDAFLNSWTYWYTYNSVITGNILSTSKFFNAPHLFPFPNVLAHQDFFLVPTLLLYAPSYILIGNHILSVNLAIFGSFILNYISAYICLKYLTKNNLASILGAVIFTYSPNVIQLFGGHIEYMNRFFIPPYFVLLYNYFKNPSLRNILFVSILYTLLWFSNIEIAIFTTILTVVAFVIFLISSTISNRIHLVKIKDIFKYSPLTLLFIPIIFYFFYPYYDYSQKENFMRTKNEAAYYAAKPIDYFIPFINNTFLGQIAERTESNRKVENEDSFNYAERTLLPGYLVLLLTPYFIFKKIKTDDTRWQFYFWLLVFGILFTFGPYYKIFGKEIKSFYYYLYDLIPIIQSIRTPTRIQYVYLFFIAYIFTDGLTELFKKMDNHKSNLIFFALLLFLIFEYKTTFSTIWIHSEIKTINFDLENKRVLFLPITETESKLNDTRYNIYSINNQFISLNGHTGSEWNLTGYSEVHDVLSKNTFTDQWFDALDLFDTNYIIVDRLNFNYPREFDYLITYQDKNWIILDLNKKSDRYKEVCINKQLSKDDIKIKFIFNDDKKLLLNYTIDNPFNCNLFIDASNRYFKVNLFYNIKNSIKHKIKFIALPTFLLKDELYINTFELIPQLEEQPNLIKYNIEKI